jgi:hypothetical protein
MSRPKRQSKNYNLVSDARQHAAVDVSSLNHARAFALYVCLPHNRQVVRKDGKSEKTAEAPPLLPREILEMIMSYFGCSVFDVLKADQRVVQFVNVKELGSDSKFARLPMRKAFPSIGASDQGYRYRDYEDLSRYENGQLTVGVVQYVKHAGSEKDEKLVWSVTVDLDKVLVSEKRGPSIDVPENAIGIASNFRRHAEYINLSKERVAEMGLFRLKGEISDGGRLIRLKSTSKGTDSDLGFDFVINTPYVPGAQFDAHSGFAVGDRVRLNQCYSRYKNFAVGREGVIRDIRMYSFAVYFVELGEKDSDISRLVENAHRKSGNLHEGQLEHHVASQWFHLVRVEGGAGGVGGV